MMAWLRWFMIWCLGCPLMVIAQDFQDGEFVPQGRYLLRWGLQEGQKFQVDATQQIITESEGPLGGSGPLPVTLTIRQDWQVTDRSEKTITLLQTFRNLKIELTYPVIGKIVADTAEPEPEGVIASQVHRNLRELVDRQVQVQMDRLGKVSKYQFLEPTKVDGQSAVGQLLTPESLKNAVGQMVQFPEYSLELGDNWQTSLKVPQPNGSAEVKTEYTLQSVLPEDTKLLKIQVVPTLLLTAEDQQVEIEHQSSEGFLIYDTAQRLIRETSLTQSMTIRLNGPSPGTRKIATTVKMKIQRLP